VNGCVHPSYAEAGCITTIFEVIKRPFSKKKRACQEISRYKKLMDILVLYYTILALTPSKSIKILHRFNDHTVQIYCTPICFMIKPPNSNVLFSFNISCIHATKDKLNGVPMLMETENKNPEMGTCWHICKGGTCQRVGHVIIEI
jgi:hypothetical protein